MSPKLTIQIIGFNGAEHLARAVKPLRQIPAAEAIIRYIDNGSTDNSVQVVREALPQADVIERDVNTGYAGGHNLGFSLCTTPFVLVHDQDVVINWEGIKKLLGEFKDEKVAAVQGKLYRTPTPAQGGDSPFVRGSKLVIDSFGVVQTLSLNGVDRGAGEVDSGQFDAPVRILAAQGACALFRREALLAVAHAAIMDEVPDVFDQEFFAYKEEVDLGWQLTKAGWKVIFAPIVAGHHARTLGRRGVGGWGLNPREIYARLKSHRTRMSLRNYCWMIAKNVSLGQLILHSPFILGRLFIFFAFTLIYPPLFSVWAETIRGLPRMLAKRP